MEDSNSRVLFLALLKTHLGPLTQSLCFLIILCLQLRKVVDSWCLTEKAVERLLRDFGWMRVHIERVCECKSFMEKDLEGEVNEDKKQVIVMLPGT